MKRFLLIMMMLAAALAAAMPQAPDKGCKRPSPKEINEFKMKYLAQEMELSEEQTQKFIELYSKMSDERFARFRKVKELEKRVKENKNASEQDYEALSEAMNTAKIEDAEMGKRCDAQFSKFLTGKQIFKMKEGEESFRKKMREMRREKRHGKKGKK